MKITSTNINFGYGRPYLPRGNYAKVKSLVDNLEISSYDIWKDVTEYRNLQKGLSKRGIKKAEKDTFVYLPNVELKRMYLHQILKLSKRGRKPKEK